MPAHAHDSHPFSAAAEASPPRPVDARRPFRRNGRDSLAVQDGSQSSSTGAALEREFLLVRTADPKPGRAVGWRGLAALAAVLLCVLAGLGVHGVMGWYEDQQARFTDMTERLGELEETTATQRATLVATQKATAEQLQAADRRDHDLQTSLEASQNKLDQHGRELAALRKESAGSRATLEALRAEQRAALDTAAGLWRGALRVYSAATARLASRQHGDTSEVAAQASQRNESWRE